MKRCTPEWVLIFSCLLSTSQEAAHRPTPVAKDINAANICHNPFILVSSSSNRERIVITGRSSEDIYTYRRCCEFQNYSIFHISFGFLCDVKIIYIVAKLNAILLGAWNVVVHGEFINYVFQWLSLREKQKTQRAFNYHINKMQPQSLNNTMATGHMTTKWRI